jgi:sigma-B regulation protein RsbU (phosphoserine phosphatase)
MAARLKILLVEDDSADACMVQSCLSEHRGNRLFSADLTIAQDLAHAGRLIEQDLPDIILADLGLPDAQGAEALSSILQMAPNVPIIVLSGNDTNSWRWTPSKPAQLTTCRRRNSRRLV